MRKIIIILALFLVQPVFAKYENIKNMDQLYQLLINENKDDEEYVEQVKLVQKKWHEFLDAQRDILYPGWIGADRRECAYDYKKDLENTVMKLTKKLFVLHEGDICSVI